jgi:hypothetical protein
LAFLPENQKPCSLGGCEQGSSKMMFRVELRASALPALIKMFALGVVASGAISGFG